MLQGKTVVITGGSGYLGMRLACALSATNSVLLLDIRPPQSSLRLNMRFERCGVEDLGALTRLLAGVDVVFHRAGLMGSLESMRRPSDYYRVNVEGTLNVLEAARINRVKRFIFDSTETVYGTDAISPITEETSPAPRSIYGATKLIAERLVGRYDETFDLSTITFRYSRARDAEKRDAIFLLGEKILNGEDITLYNDGVPVIDFCDVDDLVRANILGAASMLRNQAVNISSGEGISFFEMVDEIRAATGRTAGEIKFQAVPPFPPTSEFLFGPTANYMSIEKAKRLLGWSPRVFVRDTIRQTVEHLRGLSAAQ